MTRSVTFNGQTQFRPGGITRVNAQGLTPVGISSNGIVALLGEAEGGEPNTVITLDDPALAQSLFRSGPLADAIRIAFDPSSDPRVPGGAFRTLLYKTNASTQATTQLPSDEAIFTDTAAGVPTTTNIPLTTNTTMVVNTHAGRWFQLDGSGERRRIVSNTATDIVVSPGFSTAPIATDPVRILASSLILTSRDYGSHTNSLAVELEAGVTSGTQVFTFSFENKVEQSPELGGVFPFRVKYVGGPVFNGTGNVTAIDVTGLIITTDLTAAGVNDAAGMVLQFDDGTQREIASNTTGAAAVYTLAAGHALSTAQIASLATAGVSVRNITSAAASVVGANGVATSLTSAVLPTADDLALTFVTGETLRQFADRVNGTTNYELTVTDGVNQDTTLMADFDFGTAATAVDVRFDTGQTAVTNPGGFLADLKVLIDWVNAFSELSTAERALSGTTEGAESPLNTGGVTSAVADVPIYYIGGTRGTSSNTDFQNGFDALAQFRSNSVVPLISEDLVNEGFGSTATFASVAAQLAEHVNEMNSTGKNEQGGYVGCKCTRAELGAQSASLNNTDVAVFGQQLTTLDAAGNLTVQPEWSIAVAAAGMRAGVPEVGEPLTFKFIKTNALAQDSSWNPRAITDANFLLARGVMFAESVEGSGFRFVRDITTYLLDENIAFLDGNTRDAVRFIAYDLRTGIENQFTGLKATPANAASIRSFAISKMDIYRRDNIIVDSLGPESENSNETYPGWRNLVVSITGNVATIRIEVFPVTGIVYQLNDIYLQLPRIVA